MARRMAQAPNSYPSWLAPKARVVLGFSSRFLTNFSSEFVDVGPPSARLRYKIIGPADYQFAVTSSHSIERGKQHAKFSFTGTFPGKTNAWSDHPKGTVVLLHGYGLGIFAMAPWAVRLAQDGWQCVLVDLRGHGKSTGSEIYFGIREAHDLSQLIDALTAQHKLQTPVHVMGESYGASLALRWKANDPRVHAAIAIAPYAEFDPAVINICREYAHWMPLPIVKAGLKELPSHLQVEPDELDTTHSLKQERVAALFVAGGTDHIVPTNDVDRLRSIAAPKSKLIVVPNASHEAVTYYFDQLTEPILNWLDGHAE